MTTSIRQFRIELFQEHLEEASFLYNQRLAYSHDPELTWRDLDGYEARFDAHIDALVVGTDLALEVCKEHCASGDFGELHAALCVFCRHDRSDLAYAVLQDIDYGDKEVTQAVIDALKTQCPEAWHDDLIRIMLGRCKELIPILASVLAYRRVRIEEPLLRVLKACPSEDLERVIWALGRIGSHQCRAALNEYLRSDDADIAAAACRSLIRLGDYHAIRHGLLVAQMKSWPVPALGVGGNHAAVNVLSDLAKGPQVTEDVLLALGLLGDLGSVTIIFNCLTNSDCATAAATALQTITGAALYEEVFVPDEMDPDELFEEERQKYEQTGEVPTRPDGEPFGSRVAQISVSPETWRNWLAENKARFDPKLRYRHGKPHSPQALLESLRAEHTPNRIRDLTCDEFVVRYGADVSMQVDMPVRAQDLHLAALEQWVRHNTGKYEPGKWYFACKPMD